MSSNVIFIVKAEKVFFDDSVWNSIIFSSFDQDKAVNFAKTYFSENDALSREVQGFHYLNVSVSSTVVGIPNSEFFIWDSSNLNNFVDFSSNNVLFSYDLEKVLIEKHKESKEISKFSCEAYSNILSFIKKNRFSIDSHSISIANDFIEDDSTSLDNLNFIYFFEKYEKPHLMN